MSDPEVLACHRIEIASLESLPGGKRDRVDDDIKAVPVITQRGKEAVNFAIINNIAR